MLTIAAIMKAIIIISLVDKVGSRIKYKIVRTKATRKGNSRKAYTPINNPPSKQGLSPILYSQNISREKSIKSTIAKKRMTPVKPQQQQVSRSSYSSGLNIRSAVFFSSYYFCSSIRGSYSSQACSWSYSSSSIFKIFNELIKLT